jgi:hypothetical protein
MKAQPYKQAFDPNFIEHYFKGDFSEQWNMCGGGEDFECPPANMAYFNIDSNSNHLVHRFPLFQMMFQRLFDNGNCVLVYPDTCLVFCHNQAQSDALKDSDLIDFATDEARMAVMELSVSLKTEGTFEFTFVSKMAVGLHTALAHFFQLLLNMNPVLCRIAPASSLDHAEFPLSADCIKEVTHTNKTCPVQFQSFNFTKAQINALADCHELMACASDGQEVGSDKFFKKKSEILGE